MEENKHTSTMVSNLITIFHKQGIAFLVMFLGLWVQYSWISENNAQIRNELKDQRIKSEECNSYNRDIMQKIIEDNTIVMHDVIERLNKIESN